MTTTIDRETRIRFEQLAEQIKTATNCTTARARATAAKNMNLDEVPAEDDPIVNEEATPGVREDSRILDIREIGVREARVEQLCDTLVKKTRGKVIRFSQSRATRQTTGIADRIYTWPDYRAGMDQGFRMDWRHPGLAFWYEVKADDGEQTGPQKEFERLVTRAGWIYLLGGYGDLKEQLKNYGIVLTYEGDDDDPVLCQL